MDELSNEWLRRAKSSLELAKTRKEKIFLEDLCFEAQQAAEKALKALLIHLDIVVPRVHSFNIILSAIAEKIEVPHEIEDVFILSDYAVQTRYPGDYTPITVEEYDKALAIAEKIISWVEQSMSRIDDGR